MQNKYIISLVSLLCIAAFQLLGVFNTSLQHALLEPAYAADPTFKILIKSASGLPVPAVTARGTNGFGLDTSDSMGEIIIPSKIVSPMIVLTNGSKSFFPNEFIVNLQNCPGYICRVTAGDDGIDEAVTYSMVDSLGHGVKDIPVNILKGQRSCNEPHYSDGDGLVVFAVKKHSQSCLTGNNNPSDDPYTILPLSPQGQECTFSTLNTAKFNVCTNNGPVIGYATANCTPFAPLTGSGTTQFTLKLLNRNTGSGIQGTINLDNGGGTVTTDTTGTARVNLSQNIEYTAVVTGVKFETQKSFKVSPSLCRNNQCIWYGATRDFSMAAVPINITNSANGSAMLGVTVDVINRCNENERRITDRSGLALFGSYKQTTCTDSAQYIGFNPSLDGYTFSHTSGTPFQVCATSQNNPQSVVGSLSSDNPNGGLIHGVVYDLQGLPSSGVEILNGGVHAANTDYDGKYSISVNKGSTVDLKPRLSNSPLKFDPDQLQIVSVQGDTTLDFYEVAPDPEIGSAPPISSPCPVQETNVIEGTVFSSLGQPVKDALVLHNLTSPLITDSDGHFKFTVPQGSDNWVAAFYSNWEFSPVAFSEPTIRCDKTNADFVQIGKTSYVISGTVQDFNRNWFKGADVTIELSNGTKDTRSTNDEGEFEFESVPEDLTYRVVAIKTGHVFIPTAVSDTANKDNITISFTEAAPTPTATVTPTLTPTPTFTQTATVTPTFTVTSTFTVTPTVTNSYTPTVTSTSTSTPTVTQTATRTATFTATSTSTATSTNTATSTSTFTATPEEKVTICHIPPGNPEQKHTLQVGKNAVNAHLGHGDFVGDCSLATATPTITPEKKVTICHLPPGNPENKQTITVGEPAVKAHLAHGDFIGDCSSITPSPTATFTRTATPTNTPTFTPTSTATLTPTNTATNAPTFTFTSTPTATSTPVRAFILTSLCADNSSSTLYWKLINPYSDPVQVSWDIYFSGLSGTLIAAPGENYFTTAKWGSGANSLRIFLGTKQIAVQSASISSCPTPTPTPTFTPTNTPTFTPLPGDTATPTPTPTETSVAIVCGVSGSIREGGSKMSDTFLARLIAAQAKVTAQNVRTRVSYSVEVAGDNYSITLPCDATYKVQFVVPSKAYAVRSRPENYTRALRSRTFPTATGLDFGIRATGKGRK